MLSKEEAISNYFAGDDCRNVLQMNSYDGETTIALMQEVHSLKKYKIDTLFLSCSLLDKYLFKLLQKGDRAPNLALLALVCLLIAAKVEEHIKPCFDMTIKALPASLQKQITVRSMVKLEL